MKNMLLSKQGLELVLMFLAGIFFGIFVQIVLTFASFEGVLILISLKSSLLAYAGFVTTRDLAIEVPPDITKSENYELVMREIDKKLTRYLIQRVTLFSLPVLLGALLSLQAYSNIGDLAERFPVIFVATIALGCGLISTFVGTLIGVAHKNRPAMRAMSTLGEM